MSWPVTLNGKTYNTDDIEGMAYADSFGRLIDDFAADIATYTGVTAPWPLVVNGNVYDRPDLGQWEHIAFFNSVMPDLMSAIGGSTVTWPLTINGHVYASTTFDTYGTTLSSLLNDAHAALLVADPSVRHGALAKTLAALTISSTGAVTVAPVVGTLTKTLAALTISSTGAGPAVPAVGTLTKTLSALTLASIGEAAVDVFIFAGSSNAMNAGVMSPNTATPPHYGTLDTNIKTWNGSSWETYEPYVNSNGYSDGFLLLSPNVAWGPEAEFAYQWRQLNPNKPIYIVKEASNATALALDGSAADWNVRSSYQYFDILALTTCAALRNLIGSGLVPKVSGLFWMQGEQDRGSTQSAAYQANLEEFVATLRQLTKSTMPLLIGRIYPYTDGLETYTTAVRSAQVAAASSISNANYVNTDDATLIDGYNWNSTFTTTMGARIVSPMLALTRPSPPALPFSRIPDPKPVYESRWGTYFGLMTFVEGAATDPDGTTKATKLKDNNFTASRKETTQNRSIGTATSFEVYAKEAGPSKRYLMLKIIAPGGEIARAIFDTSAGTVTYNGIVVGGLGTAITAATCTSVGSGWFKCVLAITSPSGSADLFLCLAKHSTPGTFEGETQSSEDYDGDNSSGVYVYDAKAYG